MKSQSYFKPSRGKKDKQITLTSNSIKKIETSVEKDTSAKKGKEKYDNKLMKHI